MKSEQAEHNRQSGVSKIRSVLGHVRPKKRFGQTFMIDPNLLSALVRDADIESNDVVLEIGTGTGRLTEVLAGSAATVITVEIDSGFARIARNNLTCFQNVEIINADVLNAAGSICEEVERSVLAAGDGRAPVVVANLPYSTASRILAALFLWQHGPARAVVTLQKEVGERLAASPGTKAYGKLSVLAQSAVDVQLLRIIPPECFWPRPTVYSAVVRLGAPKTGPDTLDTISSLAGGVFQHRRKTIRNALLQATNIDIDPRGTTDLLGSANIDDTLRADALTPLQFERLAACISASARSSGVLMLKKLSNSGSKRRTSSSST